MKKYQVEVTNGAVNKFIDVRIDGNWVTDERSAIKMAESKINSAWTVIACTYKEAMTFTLHIGGTAVAEFEIEGDDRQEMIEKAWNEADRRITVAGFKTDLDYGLTWDEVK
jgi:hypothetical protein